MYTLSKCHYITNLIHSLYIWFINQIECINMRYLGSFRAKMIKLNYSVCLNISWIFVAFDLHVVYTPSSLIPLVCLASLHCLVDFLDFYHKCYNYYFASSTFIAISNVGRTKLNLSECYWRSIFVYKINKFCLTKCFVAKWEWEKAVSVRENLKSKRMEGNEG